MYMFTLLEDPDTRSPLLSGLCLEIALDINDIQDTIYNYFLSSKHTFTIFVPAIVFRVL